MSGTLVLLATFAATALCIVGVALLAYDLFFRDRSRMDQRWKEEFGEIVTARAQNSPLFKELQAARPDGPPGSPHLLLRLQTLIQYFPVR